MASSLNRPRGPSRYWSQPWWASPFVEAGGGTRRVIRYSRITRAVRESESVLVCRLVNGRVTLVHRRLWPALVRVADRFSAAHLAKIKEIHAPAGHHRVEETPFPDWVSPAVLTAAAALSENEALQELGAWVPQAS